MEKTGRKLSDKWGSLLLLTAGSIGMALSFPNTNLWFLAWICLVPLMYCVVTKSPGCVFRTGWFFGTLFSAIVFAWVTHSMTVYGGLSGSLSGLALLLMAAFLGFFIGAAVWLAETLYRTWPGRIPRMALWPVCWVSMEYLKAHLPFGFAFPWNSLGQSQHNMPYVLQHADWGSFYGISFLIVLMNGFLFELFRKNIRLKEALLFAVLFFSIVPGYGIYRYRESDAGTPFRVGIIQGNVDLNEKWKAETRHRVLMHHIDLSRRLQPEAPGLFIWSESSLTFTFRNAWFYDDGMNGSLGLHLARFVENSGIPLLSGTLDRVGDDIFNAVVLISPQAGDHYFYKQKLVPFGEFVPLKDVFFFVNRLVAEEIGEFAPGTSVQPLSVPGGPDLAISICYEIIFPELIRKRVLAGGDIICNVTNDAWFGRTAASYQHFSAARFRAVETRRPVLRSANTGISGAVDSRGRIVAQSSLFRDEAFVVSVVPGYRDTIYLLFGDWFAFMCIMVLSVIAIGGILHGLSGRAKRRM